MKKLMFLFKNRKVLRIILLLIANVLLISSLTFYFVCKNIKTTIMDEIINVKVKEEFKNNSLLQLIGSDDKINNLFEDGKTKDLIEKYTNVVIEGILNKNSVSSINVEEDVISLLKDNNINIGEFGTFIKINRYYSKQIEDTISNVRKNMSKKELFALKIYKYIVNGSYKYILIGLFSINLLIILLLSSSFYKGLYSIISDILLSGIGLIIMRVVLYYILVKNANIKISLLGSYQVNMGLVLIAISIVLFILLGVFKSLFNNKKVQE